MNDVFEAEVTDDKFSLNYEKNKKNLVAVRTTNELSFIKLFSHL